MPGEMVPIAGMVLSLLLALILGGVVLVYPVTKRLGRLLELRIEERREGLGLGGEEVERLAAAVESLEARVALLTERQQFTERLLGQGEREESGL